MKTRTKLDCGGWVVLEITPDEFDWAPVRVFSNGEKSHIAINEVTGLTDRAALSLANAIRFAVAELRNIQ